MWYLSRLIEYKFLYSYHRNVAAKLCISQTYKRMEISMMTIDEAHCISRMGDGFFRLEYPRVRERVPKENLGPIH